MLVGPLRRQEGLNANIRCGRYSVDLDGGNLQKRLLLAHSLANMIVSVPSGTALL